ncbi:MAG: serine/threonine-protein kinase [Planctomycetota bacterium]
MSTNAGGSARAGEVDLPAGTRIGGYELKKTIGSGTLGTVYRALQLSLDRPVAIKILSPGLARDEEYVQRFHREARTVARLNHPNVISGIDVGEDGGYRYFVMELVAGLTIRHIVERGGPMDESRVAHIAQQISRALDHGHQLDLVHRDVKPENIIVTNDGVAKLCDLGLAKDRPEEGRSLGTPAYISPEQARGLQDVDIRSDLYSLGASMYHMLAGRVPFEGTPPVVMTLHASEDPVPLRRIDPEVSADMEAIVARLMQKDRGARFQTPAELTGALDGYRHKRRRRTKGPSPRRVARRRRR